MEQAEQDALDARRWRAVRTRYAHALCRLTTDSPHYNTATAPAVLDAWADAACAEIEAFNPAHWINVEVPRRTEELQRELEHIEHAG